ncbi:PDZ domain-containing protein [Verrucomicrobiaceae bacterium N1E253]|uniref:PDZ domain-containing protein n=1 Tax=Oceaniferula marina TaxID=2748318 RepID=A0A851G986_9BACT|nr:PDZ domain-containing protein [Oceaniferula marina]NWK54278.1 PDZ domain-containing protein [Oceaniferula marina]
MKATPRTTNQRIKWLSTFGIGTMLLALPVTAIERPSEPNDPKPKEGPQGEEIKAKGDAPEVAQVKRAMLGLGGAPASEILSLHLGLKDGQGLLLFHVIPGSAADKAGLKPHDIITQIEGIPIGSQDQLREQIFKHKPGDEVKIQYIHAGKRVEKKITLGERPAEMRIGKAQGNAPGGNPWMFKGLGGQIPEGERMKIEKQIQQHMDRMRKQFDQKGMMELRFDDIEKAIPKDGNGAKGFQMNASTSISISDEEGSVTMKTVNGKKEVVVRDKKGEIVFEGPYDNEQDKAALPDDIRDRVGRLDLGKVDGNGLRLRILPGQMKQAEQPDNEEEAQ